MMSLHGETIGGAPGQSADLVIIEIHHNNLINLHIACAARSCMIFSFVCSISTSVALSEAAPSSEGRFVDAACSSAACNFCAAATQVGPCSRWIRCPNSRKQSSTVGYLLDIRMGPCWCAPQPPCEDAAEHLRLA